MGLERTEDGGIHQLSRLSLAYNKLNSLPPLCQSKWCLLSFLLEYNNITMMSDWLEDFEKLRFIDISLDNLRRLPTLHWIRLSFTDFVASLIT